MAVAAPAAGALARSFAEGIVWPRQPGRALAILLASIVIKLIAMSHFLWAGLAFGVLLPPAAYLFLLLFLGFLIVLTHIARVPGGFVIGGLFALDRLGVTDEPALAMVLTVELANILAVSCVGAFAMWRYGLALRDLRTAGRGDGAT